MKKISNYLKFQFQGFFKSIQSERFFKALEKDNKAYILKLISKKKDLMSLREYLTDLSPLHVIIRDDKQDYIMPIFKRQDIGNYINSSSNKLNWTPLHIAAGTGNVEVLNLMARYKLVLSSRNLNGLGAVHIACGNGKKLFVEKLLELGVHVNETDANGWTPLHYASAFCHTELGNFLISKGAKPSIRDEKGFNPLLIAILRGHFPMVQLLYPYKDSSKETLPIKPLVASCGLADSLILEWLHGQGEDIWQRDLSVYRI
jgi:ankyrin repeat protein